MNVKHGLKAINSLMWKRLKNTGRLEHLGRQFTLSSCLKIRFEKSAIKVSNDPNRPLFTALLKRL